jgi:tetratricopeptide (TPR) repeat protein
MISVISLFLDLRGNLILRIAIDLLQIGCVIFGLIMLKKNNSKIFRLCFLSVMLLFISHFVVSTNVKILKADSRAVNVYSVVKRKKADSKYAAVFKTSQYENVTLFYHPDLKPALKLINTYLKEADEETDKLFPKVEKKPLTIRLDYDEKVFKNIDHDTNDMEGFYNGVKNKIDILAEDCYSNVLASSDFKNTLLHEYSHYKLKEYVEQSNLELDKIPAWFNEGVASYIGFEGAYELRRPEKLVPLKELTNQKDWVGYSNETEGQVYVQAHYAVSQLILSKGNKVIQDILLKTKALSFEAAFKEVMGICLEDHEKALEADMKNEWKNYRKITPAFYPKDISAVKSQCLEEYIKTNPDNIDALFDLGTLYSGSLDYEKAKQKINTVVEKQPENSLAWRRLAIVLEKMNDFDGALKAYEKEISVSKDNFDSYISMADILLMSDTDKAVSMVSKAIEHNKASYISKQGQEIKNYIKALENNKPYEGCLKLIKSDTINSVAVKKALIQKVIKDYPNVKNAARTELEKMKL